MAPRSRARSTTLASIAWTDVANHATELAGSAIPTATQTDILAYANGVLVVDEFGGESSNTLKLARIYLAAHYGTLTLRGDSAAGPVIGEAAGPLSRSYGNVTASMSLLEATTYGKAFLALLYTTQARAPQVL